MRVFDTAWYYGPDIPNQLLARAIRDYPGQLVVASKLGWEFDRAGRLVSDLTPERLRAGMERDLRTLGSDTISVVHLRWSENRAIDARFVDAVAAMGRDARCEPVSPRRPVECGLGSAGIGADHDRGVEFIQRRGSARPRNRRARRASCRFRAHR